MSQLLRLLIIGPPGSGKGTIATRLVKAFGLTHLSSGDLIRSQISKESEVGRAAKTFVTEGKLVPDDIVSKLVLEELKQCTADRWLLDGFPRTIAQARLLDENFALSRVIHLDVPFEEIIRRVSERWIHPSSGRVYNLSYNPPKLPGKDDVTGEDLVQREDDRLEAVQQRLQQYNEDTLPLLDYYNQKNLLVTFSGDKSDVLFPQIEAYIKEAFSV